MASRTTTSATTTAEIMDNPFLSALAQSFIGRFEGWSATNLTYTLEQASHNIAITDIDIGAGNLVLTATAGNITVTGGAASLAAAAGAVPEAAAALGAPMVRCAPPPGP